MGSGISPRVTHRGPLAVALGFTTAVAVGLAACTSSPGTPNVGPSGSTAGGAALSLAPPNTPYDANTDPVVQVVRRVSPAVVNVTTRTVSQDSLFGGTVTGKAVGTGFIVRSDGVIVTNCHVVEGALTIKVALPPPDTRTFPAHWIGGDCDHDLAVLEPDHAQSGLPTVALGDSSRLELGERVIALGYALALPGGPTVTSGIISALQRTVQASD